MNDLFDLDFEEFGRKNNSSLICIGGLGTQRSVWPLEFCEFISQLGYRLVRFDNRDIGSSQYFIENSVINNPPYTLEDMAKDTLSLIDKLSLKKVHLVGMSMGGQIAHIIASKNDKRISSLTSIMSTTGSSYLPSPSFEALNILKAVPKDPNNIEEVLELTMKQQAIIGSPEYPMSKEYLRSVLLKNILRGNNLEGVKRQWLALMAEGDQRQLISKIRVPTLVIHGENDCLIPKEAALDISSHISNSTLKIISGMGHSLSPKLSLIIAKMIVNFIEKL